MRPLSYSFDGASALYLPYVVGSGSRKAALSDRAEVARFLVYRAETRYNWRSVLLTGRLEAVPETEWDAVGEVAEPGWRPDLFERAAAGEATALYRFRVDEWSGLKHVGLPPGFEAGGDGDAE
jgi:hypothetical protein